MSPRRAALRLSTALALCTATLIACGGRSSDIPNEPHADGGMLAPGEPSDATLPPGVAFMEGTIKCCEKGLGQTCCTAREKDVGECAEFQGCTPSGHAVIAKIVCSICCEGLVPMNPARYVDGKCESPRVLGSNVCAPCGDGVCNASAGENPCSCPVDCGPPP